MMSVCEKRVKNDKQNCFNKRKISSDVESYEEIPQECMESGETDANKAEEKVLPEIAGWRRAEIEDMTAIEELQKLTGDVVHSLYRKKDILELIEHCYCSIVQFDSMGSLVSFTSFDSYPNIPSTPFWSDWLSKNYRISGISPGNVLFVHYMVWQPEYEDKFLPLLLETSFGEFLRVKYIIIVKPPKTDIPHFYTKYFFPLLPFGLEELENSSIQLLLLCLRSSIIQPLCIRIAFDQEIDIIMSVLRSSLMKGRVLGSSCVWDLVNFVYNKDKKILICEIEGQLVGIMVVNLKFDLDVLNEGFELAQFNGLRKKDMGNKADDDDEDDDDDTDNVFPEKTSSKEVHSTNLLMSSKLLLSPMNWEMSFSRLGHTESTLIASESHFSQFSFLKLSSVFDLKKGDLSEMFTQKKSEFKPKMEDLNVMIRPSRSTMTHFYPPKYHAFWEIIPQRGEIEGPKSIFFGDKSLRIRFHCLAVYIKSHSRLMESGKRSEEKRMGIKRMELGNAEWGSLPIVRVAPRPLTSYKQELYLCHKNSLSIISMSVRSAQRKDLADISNFLKYVDEGDTVYDDIISTCFEEDRNFESFVLTFGDSIVGVSLVNCQDFVEHFHMYFEVADFACPEPCGSSNRSVIEHLVISPQFYNHARFFVRDIMRLVDVTGIYYATNSSFRKQCNLLTILGEFVPLKPKRKVGSNNYFITCQEKTGVIPVNLHFLNPRLCGLHKIHINIVIVVVGASQTALSFLENLVFGPGSSYYNYNNLICISPHGLEVEEGEDSTQELMFPIKDNYSSKYISMLSLYSRVSFIHGVMTEINRSDKYIVVNNKSMVRYDYLVLTCGLQYLLPIPEAQGVPVAQQGRCKNVFRSSLTRYLLRSSNTRPPPVARNFSNMFIINTRRDAENALSAVQVLVKKTKKENGRKIIVYGHDLHVFLTINTLLKLGIPGEFIVFVEPFPSNTQTVTLFNDYSVDQAVLESVKQCKVTYYTEYYLYDWSVGPEDYITSIKFHSKRKQLVIPCLAFFPFLERLVSDVTFNACNNAGLVYDGRLVINHNFRTNDSSIYAAGTFTKYARRYFAAEFNHQYYNSTEVGKKLAEILRGRIDPSTAANTKENSELVPRLVAPILLHCQLPGDFNLFTLRKPGKELDLETAYNICDYGEVLTTGDCKMKNGYGYFRLHLNPEGFVESITCYTKDEIDYGNLSCLYGLHERILNNLLLRYDMSVIPDFFEYFRQPWALALFHDNFQRVRELNRSAFFQKIFEDKNFYEKVVEELEMNNWKQLEDSVKQKLETDYLNSRIHDDIKNNLLRFLHYYKDELPVYNTDDVLKDFFRKHGK